jgi:hypothetical protein
MGCWDIFCFICGNNCNNLKSDEFSEKYPEYEKLYKKLNWKKNCTLLLLNNEVVHDCIEQSCNVDFLNVKTGDRYTANWDFGFSYFYEGKSGIYLHTDCWKYIKSTYGIELKYSDLPTFNLKLTYSALNINYGEITKYWGQDLDYQQMFLDKNIYMAFSPLESDNNKNLTRIKKIVSQLKLKKGAKEIRKGPSVSATFYPNKSIKLGNNNSFWEKKNGKWVDLKEKSMIKLYEFNQKPKNTRKIEYTPQIGQHNTIPLFVNKFFIINKKYYIEFIGSEKMINELDIFINKLKN